METGIAFINAIQGKSKVVREERRQFCVPEQGLVCVQRLDRGLSTKYFNSRENKAVKS